MEIDYSPLFQLLKGKKISTYSLIKNYGISKGTIDNLKHNRNVNIQTLATFCLILDCQIGDLVRIIKTDE